MRIAQIAPPWFAVPPVRYGGIEWVVALLADGLADRGHDVTLYASGGSQTRAKLVTVFEDPPGGEHIGEAYHDVVHASTAYLDADEFDLIHDHSGLIGPAIGAHVPTPVVHTLHGPFTDDAKRVYKMLSGRIWYVAISEAQREFCPDLSYAGTVHNGIDLDRYPSAARRRTSSSSSDASTVRRARELAVEVAHRTGRKLVMAVKMAEEFEKQYWQEKVEPLLDGSEEIIGEITVDEKADLLARAAAVLFPIQWPEPFGLVMTEAMATGTPVIAFPYGAAPEVIVDGESPASSSTRSRRCARRWSAPARSTRRPAVRTSKRISPTTRWSRDTSRRSTPFSPVAPDRAARRSSCVWLSLRTGKTDASKRNEERNGRRLAGYAPFLTAPSAGVSSSTHASGRHANRNGAYGSSPARRSRAASEPCTGCSPRAISRGSS